MTDAATQPADDDSCRALSHEFAVLGQDHAKRGHSVVTIVTCMVAVIIEILKAAGLPEDEIPGAAAQACRDLMKRPVQ